MSKRAKTDPKLQSILEKTNKLKTLLKEIDYIDSSPELLLKGIPKESETPSQHISKDNIDLLEYSTRNINNDSLSNSHSLLNNPNDSHSLDIKKYSTLQIKFGKFTLTEQLQFDYTNEIYIECKIPILKSKNNNEILFESFKVFINNNNINKKKKYIDINHVSYHKLNLESENFSLISNSKIYVLIHKISQGAKNNRNVDCVISTSYIDVNNIFLSKDLKCQKVLEIIKEVDNDKQKKNQRSPKGKRYKENLINNNNNNKIIYGNIEVYCALIKDNNKENLLYQHNYENEYINDMQIQQEEHNIINDIPIEETRPNIILNKTNDSYDANANDNDNQSDYEEMLVLYLNISKMNITRSPQVDDASTEMQHNYYIMHKIFPSSQLNTSDIIWNSYQPDFNYSIQMPFYLNQENAKLLDEGIFVIELWNKTTNDEVLVGTLKFDMRNILDSLKVNDYTLSTLQLNRNAYPYVIYDDFFPVDAYDAINDNNGGIYIKVLMGIGTIAQVTSFEQKMDSGINKHRTVSMKNYINMNMEGTNEQVTTYEFINENVNEENLTEEKEKKTKGNEEKEINNSENNIISNKDEENRSLDPFREDNKESESEKKNEIKDELMHYERDDNTQKSKVDELDVEEILQKGTLYSNLNETKKEQVNPFRIPLKEDNKEDHGTGVFKSSKTEKSKSENVQEIKSTNINIFSSIRDVNEAKQNEEIKQGNSIINSNKILLQKNQNIQKGNNVLIEENAIQYSKEESKQNITNNNNNEELNNSIPQDENNFYNNNNNTFNQNPQSNNFIKKNNNNNNNINININPNTNTNITIKKRHFFDIQIHKILNCQILSKIKNPYIKYQFFTDQNPLRSENLTFSSYSLDSSIIDVDMKSIHSLLLSSDDKLREFLSDFLIELCYNDTSSLEPIVIGRTNLPVEEFYYLITDSPIRERMLFIYGTEKIKRSECIIGKIKITIKYTTIDEESDYDSNEKINSDIFIEKETVYNRKIPKNCNLKFYVKKFTKLKLFEEYFRKEFSFHFVISPFGEVTSMEKKYGKRNTNKKHNVLNGDFNENFVYKLEIDQDIINYFKCRNCIIYLLFKSNSIFNEDEDELELREGKNIIGKGYMSLSEILSSANVSKKSVMIKQIGNESGNLGELTIDIELETAVEDEMMMSSISNKNNNNSINNFDNSKRIILADKEYNCNNYLNGKFLLVINFSKLLYAFSSIIGAYNGEIFFIVKIGNSIKRISPKFAIGDNNNNNEAITLGKHFTILNLNYNELIELNLNFRKKSPIDIYNQFNEGVIEIKLYIKDTEQLGSFYIDIYKLITSNFYCDNILYSGSNLLDIIESKTNKLLHIKCQIALSILKINEDTNAIELYNMLYSPEFINSLLNGTTIQNVNDVSYIKELMQYNGYDIFSFVNDNIIELIDYKSEFIPSNYKKVFHLLSHINFDIVEYYRSNRDILSKSKIDFYLNTKLSMLNVNEEDGNFAIYINHSNSNVNISINKQKYFNSIAFILFAFTYYNLIECSNDNISKNKNKKISVDNSLLMQSKLRSLKREAQMRKFNIKVVNGNNIIAPKSEFTSRPNCFFILEFDDCSYKSKTILKTSQPNWNEQIEIKIHSNEYINKLNSLPVVISIFNQISKSESEFIGRAEIYPCKTFAFVNSEYECEDYYHIVNNEDEVQGQIYVMFKFDPYAIEGCVNRTMGNLRFNAYDVEKGEEKVKVNSAPNFYFKDDNEEELNMKVKEAMRTVDDLSFLLNKGDKADRVDKERTLRKEEIFEGKNMNMNINLNDEEEKMVLTDGFEKVKDKREDEMNVSSYSEVRDVGNKGNRRIPLYQKIDKKLLSRIEKVIKGK